jgi:hypothetical protein
MAEMNRKMEMKNMDTIEMMKAQMSRYEGRLLERVLELMEQPEYWIHLELSHRSFDFAPWV